LAENRSRPAGRIDGNLVLRRVPYDHPDAVALTEAAQEFYVRLYGGPDETPFTPEEFDPPQGAFLVGYLGDEPVVMGGWRFTTAIIPGAERPAEIKRMFVRQDRRGLGLARRMLAALESDAGAAGADWMVLETGSPQTAAVALYRSSGYTDIERFGYYADEPDALNLGRPLTSHEQQQRPEK
jgi:ribosomal protein S18 acetylase RimI-like enzyme